MACRGSVPLLVLCFAFFCWVLLALCLPRFGLRGRSAGARLTLGARATRSRPVSAYSEDRPLLSGWRGEV
eukprot:3082808-Rhodomonas_salina.1